MPRLDQLYPRATPWGEFAEKLARYYRLPNGSQFGLRRNKSVRMRRLIRRDTVVRRKAFKVSEHPRHPDTKVSAILARLQSMLAPTLDAVVVAISPDGIVLNGNNSLKTWQAMPGKPTRAERDVAALRLEEIQQLQRLALLDVHELDEGIEDPERKIPQAVIGSLLTRYGNMSVIEALEELRLR